MDYFSQYVSNTLAGSGNHCFFLSRKDQLHTGRIFYKIFAGGEFRYSLLFSNVMDSTYAEGDVSYKNLVCEPWHIHSAKVARFSAVPEDFINNTQWIDTDGTSFTPLTFGGSPEKAVAPGETFTSDPVQLQFQKNDYLCLELTFSGTMIPYHLETLLPVYRKTQTGWEYCTQMPVPGMIGCDRRVSTRVGFLGDSITQGIGPAYNSYAHWNALLAQMLEDQYAYWNLGLGYARANDMASLGAWMDKAKHNDIMIVCFGANDMGRHPREQITRDLDTIVTFLKDAGKKVILQTVPPFDYAGETMTKWLAVNDYIRNILSQKVDLVFDVVPFLQESADAPQVPKYGGHPNEEGSRIWAEQLYREIKNANLL